MSEAFPPPPPPDTSQVAAKPTLLLVDDEPSVLNALRRLFRSPGYRVLQATSGAEGLELLRSQAVDLVISDMRMPEMNGAQFLAAVRQHDPGVVRMLLTGYSEVSATIAAINQGEIHRYIAKPWDDQALLLTVSEALARRTLEQENARLVALTRQQNEALRDLNQNLEARVQARTAELEQVNAMLGKAYEEVNQNFEQAVVVFASLIEMRQDGIAGHARRVALLARRVAARLGLAGHALRDVALAAQLHDVGKIGFPDHMLGHAVSSYGPDALLRYRHHPRDGEAALMPLTELHTVARIVRQHHERVDGKGFPDGLAGDEILLGARIIAAASDYDDLLTGGTLAERAYTPEAARQAMRGGKGTRYDPAVVDALLQVAEQLEAETQTDLRMTTRELQPGMVLAQDLVSAKGQILLTAGFVFDARVIAQVNGFAERQGVQLHLFVRRDSIPPALPTTRPAA